MGIQTHEEWMTDFFNERCSCGIATFNLNDGTFVKMAVSVFEELEDLDHNAISFLHFHFSEWYDKLDSFAMEKVSNKDFLKIVDLKAYQVGDKVNGCGFFKIIESPSKAIQKRGELSAEIDEYELDHEDDDL